MYWNVYAIASSVLVGPSEISKLTQFGSIYVLGDLSSKESYVQQKLQEA